MVLTLVFSLILIHLPSTHLAGLGKLPLCPKPEQSFPCICSKTSLESPLDVTCISGNLATIGLPLKVHFRDQSKPIKKLVVKDGHIGHLHGPLFTGLNGPESLFIVNSSVDSISMHAFSHLNSTLTSLTLINNMLTKVPSDAISSLNLTSLDLTGNKIVTLASKSFPGTNVSTSLTSVNISNNEITKIESSALSPLSSLELLDLSFNLLTKLERNQFRGLKKLKTLDLSNNQFISFDRSDFTELLTLTSLNISNNGNLTKLPQSIFARNAQLQVIDLSGNSFKEVDAYILRGVRFLKKFFANHNSIESIAKRAFSTNTRIRVIDLSHNKLTVIPADMFNGLSQLDTVDISHNLVKTIEANAFVKVFKIQIDLSHNELTVIPRHAFVEAMNITKLDLSHNKLVRIHNEAFSDSDITDLYLQHNSFTNSSLIPLANLTSLSHLNVSYNNLTSINRKSFGLGHNVKLYSTAVIDLSHNKITEVSGSIFEKFWALRFLNMSHNSLRRLGFGAFGNLPTLLEMDIRNNRLSNVNSGAISGLVSLKNLLLSNNVLESVPTVSVALNDMDLSNNSITQVSCSAFPMINSLLRLNLKNNSLDSLSSDSFCNLLTLRYLDLSGNKMVSLDSVAPSLQRLASLQYLDLSNNKIGPVNSSNALGTLATLFDLNLSGNLIDHISPYAFNGLLQLLSLNLSTNSLKTVPTNSLTGLVSLRTLDLSYNSIGRIENRTNSFFEDLLSLETLNLRGNRISFLTSKSLPSSQWIPYKLKKVDLSRNQIESLVTSVGFTTIESLYLNNNHIRNLAPGVVGNFTNLRTLDLSNNKLTSVAKYSFTPKTNDSTYLEDLNLSNNLIEEILPGEISKLAQSLRVLDLSGNRLLNSWPSHDLAILVSRGARVLLHGNPLPCNCKSKVSMDIVKSNIPNISPELAKNLTIDFDVNNENSDRFILAGKAIPQYAKLFNPTLEDWNSINCTNSDSTTYQLSNLDEEDLDCSTEQSKSLTTSSVVIRGVHWARGLSSHLKVGWFVRDSSKDIAKFKVELAEETLENQPGSRFESLELPYTERDFTFEGLDFAKGHKICLKSYNSHSKELKTYKPNCVSIPPKRL